MLVDDPLIAGHIRWGDGNETKEKNIGFHLDFYEFKVGVSDTILLSYAFWGMLSCILICLSMHSTYSSIHLWIYLYNFIDLHVLSVWICVYTKSDSVLPLFQDFPHELGRAAMVSVVTMSGSKETVDCILNFEEAKGWTKPALEFLWLHSRKLTTGYPQWWLGKGNSLNKWQCLGIYVRFLGCFLVKVPNPWTTFHFRILLRGFWAQCLIYRIP